jgi:hypothetical protein
MNPDEIQTSRLAVALNKVRNIEINMQVLAASLKERGFIDARIALGETERLVQVLHALLDELDPQPQTRHTDRP